MRFLLPIASLLLYAAACYLPALEFTAKTWRGGEILVFGWLGIIHGVIGCYANPVWLFALIMAFVGKTKLAVITGLIAFAIGCTTFLMFGRTLGSEFAGDVSGNHQEYLNRLLPGAYLWLASLLLVPLSAFVPKT